jgi:hypothetical protein
MIQSFFDDQFHKIILNSPTVLLNLLLSLLILHDIASIDLNYNPIFGVVQANKKSI